MTDFTGIRALVTGSSSGIGLATARLLTSCGATVVGLDLSAPPGDVRAEADGHFAVHGDVADDASVRTAVALATTHLGGLDVLVNNAGIGARGTVADNDDTEWHRVLDINVLGAVRTVRATLPHLREAGRTGEAAIVNTCSIAATAGLPERALYSASKGALASLTLAMAADHLAEGIRVNCVHPGTVDTPWVGRLLATAEDPDAARAALEARQPTGRLVTPDEVAHAIAHLAAPSSSATTGTALAVDGGMHGLRLRR